MDAKSKRNIVLFVLVALSSGWIGVIVDRILPEQTQGDTLGMGIWLVLPLLAVILLRSFAGDGWRGAGFTLRLGTKWPWYLVAVIMYPLVTSIVLLVGHLTGWIDVSPFGLKSFAGVFLSLLFGQFIKNIFEESVWRGYLTDRLVRSGLKDWGIYGIAGLTWGIWHLPYYLFFLPDQMMLSVLPVDKVTFAAVAILSMVAWSILFAELYRVSGSIWPGVLMHAIEDSLLNPLVIDGYVQVASGKEIWISPIAGLLPTILYAAAGLTIRHFRLRSTNSLQE